MPPCGRDADVGRADTVAEPENAGCNAADTVDIECVEGAAKAFFEECWAHDDYVLHEMNSFAGHCRAGVSVAEIRKELASTCAMFK